MSSKKRKGIGAVKSKRKGSTGRKELEDPITQVSTFKGDEQYADLFSTSPHKERYISHISKSPSPPLSKFKSLSQNRSQICESPGLDEGKDIQLEGSASSNQTEDNLKLKTTTFESITAFLQELDKHLPAAIGDGFSRILTKDDMDMLDDYLQWPRDVNLEEHSFIVISAFYERYLCVKNSETYEELKEYDIKEELETADFANMDDKIAGIEINEKLRTLLNFIKNS